MSAPGVNGVNSICPCTNAPNAISNYDRYWCLDERFYQLSASGEKKAHLAEMPVQTIFDLLLLNVKQRLLLVEDVF